MQYTYPVIDFFFLLINTGPRIILIKPPKVRGTMEKERIYKTSLMGIKKETEKYGDKSNYSGRCIIIYSF